MFCDSELAKKFGYSQNKSKASLRGVLVPYSVECLLKEFGNQPFSISTEASNHKEIKLFPLVIRFFTAAKGVQVSLLDMKDLPGEDSQLVADFVSQILEKHQLKWENLVCADNAPVNFGGLRMQNPNNVFKKLLLKKKNLIPVGCPAHVFQNKVLIVFRSISRWWYSNWQASSRVLPVNTSSSRMFASFWRPTVNQFLLTDRLAG